MKNSLYLLLVVLFSCQGHTLISPENKSVTVCGISNPIQDLPWLKDRIQQSDSDVCQLVEVVQGTYQGKTVYITPVNGALCCTCLGNAVFNCEGEMVFVCEPAKEEKIKNKKVIWKRE